MLNRNSVKPLRNSPTLGEGERGVKNVHVKGDGGGCTKAQSSGGATKTRRGSSLGTDVQSSREVVDSMSEESLRGLRKLHQRAEESQWGFHLICRLQGADAAKDAMGSALTTTGVVSALMLTFTFPLLVDPPSGISEEGSDSAVFRVWWYLQVLTVFCSFMCLFAYTIMYLYLQHLPSEAVAAFLLLIKPTWLVSNVLFVASIALALWACMACVQPSILHTDWIVSVVVGASLMVGYIGAELWVDSWFVSFVSKMTHFVRVVEQDEWDRRGCGGEEEGKEGEREG